MARLYLKLDNVVLREYAISERPVTIGRLPDNTIQLDNLSVSGHHARIVRENGAFVLYDENSTNGTYVNGLKVGRTVLADGDSVHVGRHMIAFTEEAAGAGAPLAFASTQPTAPPVFGAPTKTRLGVLTVLSGKTDQPEYVLVNAQTVIGKSEGATIQLMRWFAPKVAAIIYCRDGKYSITESQTQIAVRVNSEVVHDERELAAGDNILVDEISMIFNFQS
jgi:hypothetical protein